MNGVSAFAEVRGRNGGSELRPVARVCCRRGAGVAALGVGCSGDFRPYVRAARVESRGIRCVPNRSVYEGRMVCEDQRRCCAATARVQSRSESLGRGARSAQVRAGSGAGGGGGVCSSGGVARVGRWGIGVRNVMWQYSIETATRGGWCVRFSGSAARLLHGYSRVLFRSSSGRERLRRGLGPV